MGFRLEYCIMTNLDIDLDQIKKWWQCPTMLSTKWVCRTECSFCILLVPMVYCIMTDLVLSTKWVNRIECSFADRPDSTNGDSVLPYCQQNGSAVQNVVSVIDPLQQIMTLKIGETTNYTAGSSIHINKFVDQQYGSTTQIVVSAPTSTNGVIPNRQNWYGELYVRSTLKWIPCAGFCLGTPTPIWQASNNSTLLWLPQGSKHFFDFWKFTCFPQSKVTSA